MRRAHYLKPNPRNELPRNMVFVDTESHRDEISGGREMHTLALGVYCAVRARESTERGGLTETWGRFTTASEFWGFVERWARKRTRTWVLAHNWNYDAGILFAATIPRERGWRCVKYTNEKPPFILKLRKGSRTVLLVDTLNFFQAPLASLGESVGVPKAKMPSDDAGMDAWWRYCERDVEVLKQVFLRYRAFVLEHDLGDFQMTLAAQGMAAFRHRFMGHRILIHDDELACELEREAFKGGRTECFYLGELQRPIHYLDVNSMYPYLMATKPVPRVLEDHLGSIPVSYLKGLLSQHLVVARVTVETDEPWACVRHRGRRIFPTGQFETVLTTPELRYGLYRGDITSVQEAITYRGAILFDTYVHELYALRQQYQLLGNRAWGYMAKILLNSLYGKFGQTGKHWVEERQADETDPLEWSELSVETGELNWYRQRLGMVQRWSREGESENSFPSIAAHITAYGRMMVWDLILRAGREHVYYTDTDSLLVDDTGLQRVEAYLHEDRLGYLKRQGVYRQVELWGAKDYRLDNVEKHKGVRKSAQKLSPNEFLQQQFTGWDYQLSHGQDGYVVVAKVRKTLTRRYMKGSRSHEGWVYPLVGALSTFWDWDYCDGCGRWEWDMARETVPVYEWRRVTGWVGDRYIPPGRKKRPSYYKKVKLCEGCYSEGAVVSSS